MKSGSKKPKGIYLKGCPKKIRVRRKKKRVSNKTKE